MDWNSIVNAAQTRLKELRKELSKLDFLREEEQKLVRLLGNHVGAAIPKARGQKAKGRRGGRPPKAEGSSGRRGPSKLGLATKVLKRHAGTAGMTIKEMLERLRTSNPGLFNGKDASALLSRALNQAMKAKAPKVKVLKKGGPGRPAKYGAAGTSPAAPGRKAKRKGGRPAKSGGPSKLALATEVLKKSKNGMTITAMLEQLRKSHGALFQAKNANKMLATALREATKARPPVVKVLVKGGRGRPSTYGTAA